MQYGLRRWPRRYGRPPQSRRGARIHGHRARRHHGCRGRNRAARCRRQASQGRFRRLALPRLRFHGHPLPLQGARHGRIRRSAQEHVHRHRFVGRKGLDTHRRQNQDRPVEQPARAGRLSRIHGRSGQGRRRPLRRAHPLYQRHEQPFGRLRLRCAPRRAADGRHRHLRFAGPRGARSGMCRPGLRFGRPRQGPSHRADGIAPRHPHRRARRCHRAGQPRIYARRPRPNAAAAMKSRIAENTMRQPHGSPRNPRGTVVADLRPSCPVQTA